MWVFVKRGKLENPGKNPQSKDKNYQQTLNPHMPEQNLDHINGRRVSAPCVVWTRSGRHVVVV